MSVPPRDRGPRLARLVAGALLPVRDREFVLGDLEEAYARRVREQGEGPARRRYRRDALASVLARRFRRSAAPHHSSTSPPLRPGGSMIADVATDLRMALRSLRLRPGFSALVVVTLALGVGATTAVFALANQVLLRPLPGVRDPGGAAYVEFHRIEDPGSRTGISALDFLDLRAAATSLEGLAAYTRNFQAVSVPGAQQPVQVAVNMIHGDYFEVLGVRPLRGSLLTAEETGLDADPAAAVISEALWTNLLGRADDAIGSRLELDGKPLTVVGVAGGGFAGAERNLAYDLWVPMSARGFRADEVQAREDVSHGTNSGNLIARPRPGVSMEAAQAEILAIFERFRRENPLTGPRLATLEPKLFPGINTVPLLREGTASTLRIMSWIVVMVLLIACANVANLLLFRSLRRRGDVAVRRAMGASGARVARQELAESLVLTTLGSLGGLIVAAVLGELFRGDRLLFNSYVFGGVEIDGRVLAFTAAAVLVTTLLSGVLPAALAGRVALTDTLREAGRQATPGRGTLRSAISAAQIALCIPLLVGALLLTRTVRNLYGVDLGLSPEGAVAFYVNGAGRLDRATHAQLLDAVRAVPGVEAAALDVPGPFGSGISGSVRLPAASAEERASASFFYMTPGWFDLLRVQMLEGSAFTEADWREGAPTRVVITAPLARRLFGSTNVVGRTVVSRFSGEVEAVIAGVTGDLRLSGPERPPDEALLFPFHLLPLGQLAVLVKTPSFNPRLVEDVQGAVASVLPGLPPAAPAPLGTRIDQQIAQERMFARLLNVVSAITVLLAALGLYGVVAFAVAARRRELGIRITLGSSAGRIAGLVLGQVSLIVSAGIALGLVGAFAMSRVLESRLFGLTTTDPVSYAGGALVLVVVAALACLRPLRSAVRVDPAVTLREE